MTDQDRTKPIYVSTSDILSGTPSSTKLGPVEASILEYVISAHGKVGLRRSAWVGLLIHAGLIARGARLINESSDSTTILEENWSSNDPIRMSYSLTSRPKVGALAASPSQLQVSVAETDSQIFVNLTDTTTDKFGHLELSGPEQLRLDALSGPGILKSQAIFPNLSNLVERMEEDLWKVVLPSPPVHRTPEDKKSANNLSTHIRPPDEAGSSFPGDARIPIPTCLPDYGRSDLDPFGGGIGPIGGRGPFGVGGVGGMLLDPRRPPSLTGGFGGGPDVLPLGAVPPGARFDPFGPGVLPMGRRPLGGGPEGARARQPDPDHAMPPGFEDMYL